jgi:formamidase
MSGLGGLNKSPNGVVIGLVQLQLPVVDTPEQLKQQAARIVAMVGKARRNNAGLDLVVFPEYALHGLSMNTAPELMCSMDGPEVASFKAACKEHKLWGCFSLMEFNPNGNPYNSGIVIDDTGHVALYYRKLHPWVPVEAWEPGNLGIPVITGPKGCKLALIICHDGMFPEMARECAYKGAEIMLRTAGYTAPIRHAWKITNQANAFQNLMVTASVCLSGSDGTFDSMGEAMFCNFDGTVTTEGGGRVDEIVTCEVRPDLVREARLHWGGGEQPLPALAPRLQRREGRRDGLPLFLHAGHGEGHVQVAVGRRGRAHRRHVVRIRSPDPRACAPQHAARVIPPRSTP